MEFFAKYIREKKQLHPEYRSDFDELNKLRNGNVYRWEVKLQRNYEFHKKFFALLNLTHQNLSEPYDRYYKNFDHFRAIITMKAGFYEAIKTDKGTIYLPDSISFANMDEMTFQNVYDKVCDECCKILDMTKEIIEKELINFI